MKKLFTLLFLVAAFATSSFAQYDQQQNGRYDKRDGQYSKDDRFDRNDQFGKNDHGSYDRRYNDTYIFTEREKDMEIARINRDFDSKVRSIKSQFFMPRRKKIELMQDAERERSFRVQMVYAKFSSNKNMFLAKGKISDRRDNVWRH